MLYRFFFRCLYMNRYFIYCMHIFENQHDVSLQRNISCGCVFCFSVFFFNLFLQEALSERLQEFIEDCGWQVGLQCLDAYDVKRPRIIILFRTLFRTVFLKFPLMVSPGNTTLLTFSNL